MKQMILALAFMLTGSLSFALTTHPDGGLCALTAEEETNTIVDVQVWDIKEVASLPEALLKLVNIHLVMQGYLDQSATFAEIKNLFTTTNLKYDDLYITEMKNTLTGKTYFEIASWPGDNKFGHIWNADGEIAASIEDGDLYFQVDGKTEDCWQ